MDYIFQTPQPSSQEMAKAVILNILKTTPDFRRMGCNKQVLNDGKTLVLLLDPVGLKDA